MFVTKKKYQRALEKIEHLEHSLAEAQNLKFVFEKITDKVSENSDFISVVGSWATSAGDLILPDDVPRYVEDYFGGKVIKQEATPVTILDKNGKATYSQTAQKPDKDKRYKLVQE